MASSGIRRMKMAEAGGRKLPKMLQKSPPIAKPKKTAAKKK